MINIMTSFANILWERFIFVLKNLPVIVWYVLSATINFYGGWVLCESLGTMAQWVGGMLLLTVQFSIPYFEYQGKLQRKDFYVSKLISWLVTLACLVITTSYLISSSVSAQLLAGTKLKSTSIEMKTKQLQLDNIEVIPSETILANTKTIESLFLKINSIETSPAKNLAGHRVFVNGSPATIATITNDCTLTNSVYMTNEKLYKNECQQINDLHQQILTMQSLTSEKKKSEDLNRAVELNKQIAGEVDEIGQFFSKLINKTGLTSYVIEGVDMTNTDIEYLKSKLSVIEERSDDAALFIGVIGMSIEYGLMRAFVGQFFISATQPLSTILINLLIQFLTWLTTLPANFIFENKKEEQKKVVKVKTFDAHKWMSKINYSDIQAIQDMEALSTIKGTLPIDDLLALQLTVSHLYSAGEHLPLKSTIKRIQERLNQDNNYNKMISPKGRVLSDKEISAILKINRMKKFYWQLFTNVLLDEKNGKYYWKSEKDIEMLYYRTRKH